MKLFPCTVCGLAIAGASFILISQRPMKARLIEQNRELTGQVEQLTADNQRLSNRVALAHAAPSLSDDQLKELLRLRGDIGRLRQENKELVALREQNRQLRETLAANPSSRSVPVATEAGSQGYWPKESWAFAGYSTPESAFQSVLWSASRGDLKNLL